MGNGVQALMLRQKQWEGALWVASSREVRGGDARDCGEVGGVTLSHSEQ